MNPTSTLNYDASSGAFSDLLFLFSIFSLVSLSLPFNLGPSLNWLIIGILLYYVFEYFFAKREHCSLEQKATCSLLRASNLHYNDLFVAIGSWFIFCPIFSELQCQENKLWGEGIFSLTLRMLFLRSYTVLTWCSIFLEHVNKELWRTKGCMLNLAFCWSWGVAFCQV